jgi:hypothetical protein
MTATELAAYFMGMTNGRRAYHPRIRFYRARHVVIRAGEKLPVVSDKDVIEDRRELEIELVPRAINVIVGNGSGLTLPVEAVPSVPPLAGPQPRLPDQPERVEAPASKPGAEPVLA